MTILRARALRRILAAAAALLAPAALACTFVRPLDYLTNGADGATAADHGVPGSDGSLDTTMPGDAGDAGDARVSTDTGNEAAPAGAWCVVNAPTAFLCADFDEAELTSAYQSGLLVTIPGPAADPGFDASIGVSTQSPPGDFLVSGAPVPDGGVLIARYEQPVSVPSASKVRLRFDLRLVALTVGEEIDFASIDMYPADGGAPARAFLSIQTTGQGLVFLDTGTATEGQPFAFPADGAWHTYELEIDLVPNLTTSVYRDLGATPVAAVTDLSVPYTVAAPATFYLGVSVYGPASSVQVAYDNAVLTAQ